MATHPSHQLLVDITRTGPTAVVRLTGSAGMSEASRLNDELARLMEQSAETIVLDLAGMDFICSTGLGTLISTYKAMRARGGAFRLASPQPFVLRLLETTRLDRLFDIFPTREEAVKA